MNFIPKASKPPVVLSEKQQVTLQLTRPYIRALNNRKSHEIGQKGISRAVAKLLEIAPPELDPSHEDFNPELYREYCQLLNRYGTKPRIDRSR